VAVALLLVALLAAACQPTAPAPGRAGPLKRVLVLGDSITYGLFGTTPQLDPTLRRMLTDRGVALHVTGFAGENPIDTYPAHFSWILRMQHEISTWDPDMVVIQSTLFAGPWSEERTQAYRIAMRQLLTLAKSRGAHVYLVSHHRAPSANDAYARDLSQQLQAEVAAEVGGVETIPLDWWMERCTGGTVGDGWHLSAKGQNCHALAVVAAVDQLRGAIS
jgi:lysophospholipase L1-like esterase